MRKRLCSALALLLLLLYTFLAMYPAMGVFFAPPKGATYSTAVRSEDGKITKSISIQQVDLSVGVAYLNERLNLPVGMNFWWIVALGVVASQLCSLCFFFSLTPEQREEDFMELLIPRLAIWQATFFVVIVTLSCVFIYDSSITEYISLEDRAAEHFNDIVSTRDTCAYVICSVGNLMIVFLCDLVCGLLAFFVSCGVDDILRKRALAKERLRRERTRSVEMNIIQVIREVSGGYILVFTQDDHVQVCQLVSDLDETTNPPTPKIERQVVATISMDTFYGLMLDQPKENAFNLMREKVGEAVVKQILSQSPAEISQARASIVEGIVEKMGRSLERKVPQLLDEPTGQAATELLAAGIAAGQNLLIQELQAQAVERYREKTGSVRGRVGQVLEQRLSGPLLLQSSEILPRGTKHYYSRDNFTAVVVEQEPQCHTVRFSNTFVHWDMLGTDNEGTSRREFHLAFPYMIFIITFRGTDFLNLYVYYSKRSLESFEQPLFEVNLSNIFDNNRVCLGSFGISDTDLSQAVDRVLQYFWGSEFNTDLLGHYKKMKDREASLSNLVKWELASRENSLFPLRVNWVQSGDLRRKLAEILRVNEADVSRNISSSVEEAFAGEEMAISAFIAETCRQVDCQKLSARVSRKSLSKKLAELKAAMLGNIKDQFALIRKNGAKELESKLAESNATAVKAVFAGHYDQLSRSVLMRRTMQGRNLLNAIVEQSQQDEQQRRGR